MLYTLWKTTRCRHAAAEDILLCMGTRSIERPYVMTDYSGCYMLSKRYCEYDMSCPLQTASVCDTYLIWLMVSMSMLYPIYCYGSVVYICASWSLHVAQGVQHDEPQNDGG